MANYHLSIKVFSRGKGASAIAKAAYRAAEILTSKYDGQTHDYTRKGGIVHTEILLPSHAPAEYADRSTLWNAVEMGERNSNAQLAREVEISLPVELTQEQNIALAREFAKRTFVDSGMCADVCIHDKNDGNPHAHIMLTMRPIEPDGSWGAKSRKEYILDKSGERIRLKNGEFKTRKICTIDWNEPTKAEEWRKAWEGFQNAALKQCGHDVRIDHRSYERQGIEQIPTVHMGVAASQMEQRGIRTELGNRNRDVAVTNKQMGQLRARIKKLTNWVYSQPIQNAPTMAEMLNGIAGGQKLKSRWKQIADLQAAAKALIFVNQNGISDIEQLADMVMKIHKKQYDLAGAIKSDERRLGTLGKHLANVDIYNQHKAIYKKYRELDPKKRAVYAEKHADEIRQYEDARQYLKGVLNGRTTIPEKDWRTEHDKLTAERFARVETYYKLKDDVQNVERLRRGAENIMSEIAVERQAVRGRDMVL